jgi:hypothetical protein
MSDSPPGGKDRWDKVHIILAPVGGLLTAIAVASLGFIGSRTIDQQQNSEAKLRLYSELMSRREESEATLRKEMFQSIIGSFFDATTGSIDIRLLKMELLAQNFYEALNLTPLFLHLRREIAVAPVSAADRRTYEERLSDLAREVTRKQIIALESGGRRHDWTLLISDSLLDGSKSEQLEDVSFSLDGVERRFRVTVQRVDTAQRQLRIGLDIETLARRDAAEAQAGGRYSVEFDVGFFSSPMIDNTRLSNDQRVAVVLTDLSGAGANLTLVYFPGSRASLRDKPYYEEILRKLSEPATR